MPIRRTTAAPLALFLALALPAAAQEVQAPRLPLESYALPNGLTVVLQRDPGVPRVTVCVAYHVGSKNERAGRTGFAHFFEHMMFRGTRNVPNYDIPLQETGAQSNAFTTEDMTVYFEVVPSNFLERALYLEAERLAFLPSALDQEKFDTEREVVKNERRLRNENQPYGLAEEAILADLFPAGHPYSWSVIGSMKDLDNATLDDLKQFFAEFYHPANATLCLVGDFDPADARTLIQRYFGPLKHGPAPRKVSAPKAEPKSVALEQADRVQLPRLYWAWPTVADGHPDAAALDLLAMILTGGDASRLHRALVLDAEAATDVSASNDTKEIAGLFTVEATAAEDKTVNEIAKIINKELDRIRENPPSADELKRAVAKDEKGLYVQLTSPLERVRLLTAGVALHGEPTYYLHEVERYARVTPDDVRRVARQYLTPQRLQLVVRPIKPGEEKTAATLAGPKPDDSRPAPAVADRRPEGGPDWSKLPGPAAPRPFRAPKFTRSKLANGLDVWIVPWHTLPVVEARLILPGGTADDPRGKAGLAQLVATLADKGTRSKTATELAEALDALGVSLFASPASDHTTVGFSSLARNLDPALALVGEVLSSPRFDPKDVERERQLQLAGLLQGPDDVDWIARRAFRAVLFGADHPYGQPSDGTPETVKAIHADDLRAFHRAGYAPGGSTLIVVGDVEPAALVRSLETALAPWTGRATTGGARPPVRVKAEPGTAYLVDKPGAVQSVLSVGRRWVGRDDPRYFATLLGNRILGADFLSRLNQNLREKNGFTYGASSAFAFRRDSSVWLARTNVRADATAPALKELLGELDALAGAKPYTNEEILLARDAEARSYPETFESPTGIAGILQEMALFGLPPDYLDTYLARLQEAQLQHVAQAMVEILAPAERVVLVVGDRKAVEPKLKDLGFRRVQLLTPDGTPEKAD